MSEELLARLERAAAKFDKGGGDDGGEPPSVSAHTELLNGPVKAFTDASNKFNETKKIAEWTQQAFKQEHVVVQAAITCAKPEEKDFLTFVKPIVDVMNAAGGLPPKGDFFNHFKAMSEIFQASGWIMQPGPKAVIDAQAEAAKFYTSKIQVAAKNMAEPAKTDHQNWVKTLQDLMAAWAEYVNEYHKSGIVWKFKGANVLEFKAGAAPQAAAASDKKKSADERLEAVCIKLERAAAKLNKGGDSGEPATVAEYKAYYSANVTPLLEAMGKFPELKKQSDLIQKAFEYQTRVIQAATQCTKPSDEAFMTFAKPIIDAMSEAEKCDNRSPFFNHQKAIHETLQALGWLMQPGPAAFIKSQFDASQVYNNKLLMAVKDKPDPEKTNHREFVAKLKAVLENLEAYTKEHHKMGLVWNAKGKPLADFK